MKTLLDSLRGVSLEIADRSPLQARSARYVLSTHEKILKALRGKDPKEVYQYVLKDILVVQRGFREFSSESR